MRRDTLFGLSIVGLLIAGKAFASFGAPGWNSGPWQGETGLPDTNTTPAHSGPSIASKVAAFLAMIRRYESGGDYSILNGGAHFASFADHPGVIVPPGTSTAAGAYQITYGTWQDFAPAAGVSDFSPASQDAVAYAILGWTGAVDALDAGDVETAIRMASKKWTALKNNPTASLLAAYNDGIAFA